MKKVKKSVWLILFMLLIGMAFGEKFQSSLRLNGKLIESSLGKQFDLNHVIEWQNDAVVARNVSGTSVLAVDGSVFGTFPGMKLQGIVMGKNLIQVSSSRFHSMMLDLDGRRPYGVGGNAHGQLGIGSTEDKDEPVAMRMDGVLQGRVIVQISAGDSHTMMLDSDGRVYGVGGNAHGQLGDGSKKNKDEPVAMKMDGVLKDKVIKQISAGGFHTMILDSDGLVYGVGKNQNGQVGDGTTADAEVPVAMNTTGDLQDIVIEQISAGHYHTMMLDYDGRVYGVGYHKNRLKSDSVSQLLQISAGYEYIMMLDSDGRFFGMGKNGLGQLGDGTNEDKDEPVAVKMDNALKDKIIVQISAGGFHTVMLDSDGLVYGVGGNDHGQLGDGTKTNKDKPVAMKMNGVLKDRVIVHVSAGHEHTIYQRHLS